MSELQEAVERVVGGLEKKIASSIRWNAHALPTTRSDMP